MKWMKLIGRIEFKDPNGKSMKVDGTDDSWDQADWLDNVVVYDRAFGKGIKADRARVALPKTVADSIAAGDEYAPIDEAWVPCITNAINDPQTPPHPVVSVQCLPFAEAGLELLKERPPKAEPKIEAVPAEEEEPVKEAASG